jgi:hypothetical protein
MIERLAVLSEAAAFLLKWRNDIFRWNERGALLFCVFPAIIERLGGVSKKLFQNHRVIMIAQRNETRTF